MKGLEIKFECPACGNVILKSFPADTVKMLKKTLDADGTCSCGRKGGFKILSFENIEFEIKKGDSE